MITTLIDKIDNFERVRDKIAQILVTEVANQKALAIAAGKDPTDWDMDVYTERSSPWDAEPGDERRIVNVWFESASPDEAASDTVERQTMIGIFNIDCVAFGMAEETVEGQITGDEAAARNVAKTLRLVRNILMAGIYTYLDLRRLVGRRYIQGMNSFQPQLIAKEADQAMGGRLSLAVRYDEYSPQYEPEILELIHTEIVRAEDGKLLAEVDIDFTT